MTRAKERRVCRCSRFDIVSISWYMFLEKADELLEYRISISCFVSASSGDVVLLLLLSLSTHTVAKCGGIIIE